MVKINEEQLRKIIRKCLLQERISSRVFHFLPLSSMASIAKTNTFHLSRSERDSDIGKWGKGQNRINDKKKGMSFDGKDISPYYMSLSRTPSSAVGYPLMRRERTAHEWESSLVRIEMDGDLLSANFKGKPVNYFRDKTDSKINHNSQVMAIPSNGSKMRMKDMPRFRTHKDDEINKRGRIPLNGYIDYNVIDRVQMSEYEDRLLSSKPDIPNADRYIKRIDILISRKLDNKEASHEFLMYIGQIMRAFPNKTFIYYNDVAFNSINVRDAVNAKNIINPRYNNINNNDFKQQYGNALNQEYHQPITDSICRIIGEALSMPVYIETHLFNANPNDILHYYIVEINMTQYEDIITQHTFKELRRYNPQIISWASKKVRNDIEYNLRGELKYVCTKMYDIFNGIILKYNKLFNTNEPLDPTKTIYRILRQTYSKYGI